MITELEEYNPWLLYPINTEILAAIGQGDGEVWSHLTDTYQIAGLISIGQLDDRVDLRLAFAWEWLEDFHFDRRESAVCIHLLAAEPIVGASYDL